MNLIRLAIERPIAVMASVILVVLFGLVALQLIPIQLAPDLRRPVIQVTTSWPGAAPAEVEREILNRQEDVLKGLEGLKRMVGKAQDGRSRITLEFNVGSNMDKALLLVANRLDRVNGYPDEAYEPTLRSSGADDNAIAWFRLTRAKGVDKPIATFGDFAEDVVKERMERVPGVARVDVYGGGARELRIIVDPAKLARYGLTVPEIVARLRAANASITGGDVEEGKRRYIVRTDNEIRRPEDVRRILLRSAADVGTGRVGRVTVGDIADVHFGYKKPVARIRTLGEQALALSVKRETGANVINTMIGLRAAADELAKHTLPAAGLTIEQLYDETVYIESAIDLVIQNIWVGGAFAVIILLIFLRSGRATLVVALAIPVSVIGSFVAMAVLGRSLNVISLAGIAFSVGMVVDAAIVVLENIYRLRESGMPIKEAAYRGAKQVWGAILVSALTTVMVFIPILIMELDVGQLFRDIAVAISVSVTLSLIVSITVIPALSQRLLRGPVKPAGSGIPLPGIDGFGRMFVSSATKFATAVVKNKGLALSIAVVMTITTVALTWAFLPKLEYLPKGNRNLIIGYIVPPPGYNLKTTAAIAHTLEDAMRPHWASETGPESKVGEPPKMKHFFFVTFRDLTIVGASAIDAMRAGELIPLMSRPIFKEPGTFGVMSQRSVFGRGVRGARSIDLDISGPELETVIDVAKTAAGLIGQAMPRAEGNQMRPQPGLEFGAPEVRIRPDPVRLSDNGISARDLGLTIDAFNDGLRVAEITVGSERMDLMLMGPDRDIGYTQGIGDLPVVTKSGIILPLRSLASVTVTSGPTAIRHVERSRTVTLEIKPADHIALGDAIEILEREVVSKLYEQGLPEGVTTRFSGAADKLVETWREMRIDLLLALAIVYLVMAVLFESFVYPFIILLSVPLATAGGVFGLTILNIFYFQPLDMLTLLGFVILIGIVVNNAILLVHQALFHIREEGMAHADAIVEATRNRIRPIFMSTLTSVFGMLPLVVFPGAGSEIYRGLGSVVVGGLALSAILTLLIVPPLMGLMVDTLETRRRAARVAEAEAAE
ncbi:MAG: efflux RND transporter permease subunit [Alphaproteobacteria bacterium]|nr:efflux RND transporter permease subunit [Alphaproteobacteria bacterium]